MSATPDAIEQTLWGIGVLGTALLSAICIGMVKRKLVREFPCFFGYSAFHVLRYGVMFVLRHELAKVDYFRTYWCAQIVSAALGFAVIREVYQHVFRNYDALRQLGALLFRWVAAVLLIVTVIAAASAPGTDPDRVRAGAFVLERSVRVMQSGLLVFLCLMTSYFGLSWARYAFGIALGYGVFASIELLAATLRVQFGIATATSWQIVNSLSYTCAVIVWASYFLARQPVQRTLELPAHTEIDKWNQALLELLHR